MDLKTEQNASGLRVLVKRNKRQERKIVLHLSSEMGESCTVILLLCWISECLEHRR